MAEENTTQLDEPETSNNLVFSEDEITELEKDFPEDGSTEDDSKETETDPSEGDEDDEEELEGFDTEFDEDEPGGEEDPGDEGGVQKAREGDEVDPDGEDEDEGFTLVVDGQEIQVENVDQLASLAQKGVFYEKRASESKRALDSANFTMKAMINDHFGFLEEFYAQRFGDYESARQHVGKLAHAYVLPFLKEIQAQPDQQAQLKENRRLQREARTAGQNGGQKEANTFTQEDIEQLQTLEHNVSVALDEVGLPDDSEPLRKRMAEIMLGALDREEYMHPLTAAKKLLSERQELQSELSRTAPKKQGRRGGKSPSKQKADIAAAKRQRSRKKPGAADSRGGRRARKTPEYTGREFINSLNSAMGLDP